MTNLTRIKIKQVYSIDYFDLIGNLHNASMKYELQLANPKQFYHELHRKVHFLNFAAMDDTTSYMADREDHYE